MNEHVFVSNFINVLPPFAASQEDTLSWLIERHRAQASLEQQRFVEKLFRYYAVKKEKIGTRYFALDEIRKKYDDESPIYGKNNFETIDHKSDFFTRYSIDIFNQFYPTKLELPEHLIHVTCTGYVSPSAPQVVVGRLDSPTKVTHAYHMGCYAAMPAMRVAEGLIKSGESNRIDVVHTEACSLHMDPSAHTPEQIVIQTLFADGNIKYSLGLTKPKSPSFELIAQREMILPHSENDMRWEVKKWGFAMTLSRSVPEKIAAALPDFLCALADDVSMSYEQLLRQAIFAIHPGGPKIIDYIAEQFDLTFHQISYSQKVLFERGNMSSATLPHVWQEIINSDVDDGKIIISLAFGPGLSIFGSLFRFRRGE